jgi:hypothetical protein
MQCVRSLLHDGNGKDWQTVFISFGGMKHVTKIQKNISTKLVRKIKTK